MYRDFLNARSPMRLLEKGLHGGLGRGNLGLVLAGHGVGKSSVLVGLALDELLRGDRVLHIGLDQTVAHVRAYYDTLFEELATSSHLEDGAQVHADVDRHRSIRVYTQEQFSAAKLREAVKIESDTSGRPVMVIVDGYDVAAADPSEIEDMRALAREIDAEIWLSAASADETVDKIPSPLRRVESSLSVVLALEPDRDAVALRALKDHDNPDLAALHVALDPRTLLLVRS